MVLDRLQGRFANLQSFVSPDKYDGSSNYQSRSNYSSPDQQSNDRQYSYQQDQYSNYPADYPPTQSKYSDMNNSRTYNSNTFSSPRLAPIRQTNPPQRNFDNDYDQDSSPPYSTYDLQRSPGNSTTASKFRYDASEYESSNSNGCNPAISYQNVPYGNSERSQRSPANYTEDQNDAAADQAILNNALQFTNAPPPPISSIPPLRMPVVIPQDGAGQGQPFLRAWAPALQSHGINPMQFVQFIDGLNQVAAANGGLQLLNTAGGIAGWMPSAIAQVVGAGLQIGAQVGTYAVSKNRTESYIQKVNSLFFAPRRLRVQIASSDTLKQFLRLPQGLPLLAPLDQDTLNMSGSERRFAAIAPYTERLSFDVPAVVPVSHSGWDRFNGVQQGMGNRKKERKVLKERQKMLRKGGGRDKEGKSADKALWILIDNL